MIAGHAYYFLAFVYPRMTDRRPLKTPSFLKALFADEPVVIARPEDVRFAHAPFDEIHQDWILILHKTPATTHSSSVLR